MPNYAIIDEGAVKNIIVADATFAASIGGQHQAVVDVTGTSVKIGDLRSGALFLSPLGGDREIAEGERLTLAANANSSLGPVSFQWKKDGSLIGGATAATYSVESAAPGDAGSYTCDATDGTNSLTSDAAVVTIP